MEDARQRSNNVFETTAIIIATSMI